MAEAARERGYEYIAITDHSATHGFGNDVSPDELRRQIERVRAADAAIDGIRILAGSEVNVLPDGSLDYEDDLLAQLDWIVGSLHSSFRIGESEQTERMIRGDGAPAGRRDRPPDRPADRAARSRTRSTSTRWPRPPRAPAPSSRSTATPTAAT